MRLAIVTSMLGLVVAGCGSAVSMERSSRPVHAAIPGPAAARAVVWAVGDAATPGPAPDRLAGFIRQSRPDLFLYLGDVYESGTPGDFRRFYQPRYGPLAGITMPTIGNHEWPNRFSGYYPYWARKKGHPQPPWSKRTIAGWQILDLNSQAPHGTNSPQVRWLESTLAGARATAASRSGTAPATARAPTAARPTSTRSGTGSWATPASSSAATTTTSSAIARSAASPSTSSAPADAAATQLHGGPSSMVWGRDDVNAALRMVLKPGSALLEFRGARGHVLDRSRVTCSR